MAGCVGLPFAEQIGTARHARKRREQCLECGWLDTLVTRTQNSERAGAYKPLGVNPRINA